MLMYVARVLDPHITRMYEEMSALGEGGDVDMDMGIQIVFLDGEEAFETWSDSDSLYGARYVSPVSIHIGKRGKRKLHGMVILT